MTSEDKIAANRRNAAHSTGPQTAAGKAHSSRNALRHGLAVSVAQDSASSVEIERLARTIARKGSSRAILQYARSAAEAEFDILRVRTARAALISRMACNQVASELPKYDRYERRALSRRKRALRRLDMAQTQARALRSAN